MNRQWLLLLDEVRVASVEAITSVTALVLTKEAISEQLDIGGWAGSLMRATVLVADLSKDSATVQHRRGRE